MLRFDCIMNIEKWNVECIWNENYSKWSEYSPEDGCLLLKLMMLLFVGEGEAGKGGWGTPTWPECTGPIEGPRGDRPPGGRGLTPIDPGGLPSGCTISLRDFPVNAEKKRCFNHWGNLHRSLFVNEPNVIIKQEDVVVELDWIFTITVLLLLTLKMDERINYGH